MLRHEAVTSRSGKMIKRRPADLPDFERPPVTEVVLSLQFASLPGLKNVHAGLLWQHFSTRYPNVEEYPPIAPVFETFGLPTAMPDMSLALQQVMQRTAHPQVSRGSSERID